MNRQGAKRRHGLPALFLALLVTAPALAGTQIEDVDRETFSFGSMAIGQAKDVDYARAEGLGLVPAPQLDLYLNGVLAKLLAQSPVQNVPAKVYVRASGDWAAKSTADANIYVTLGTLLRLDNEDEVAALLAHEASHVILGHANADVVQGLQQRAIQLSALAATAQGMLTGDEKAAAAQHQMAKDTGIDHQARVLLLNSKLVTPAWTRGQERDADRLGVDLLARAGYSPSAMASLLRKQQAVETARAADRQTTTLDQQLGYDARGDVTEQTTAAAKKLGAGAGAGDVGELAGSALGSVLEWGSKKVDEAARSHPKTDERIAEITEYVGEEYPDGTQTVQVETWEAAKEADGTVDILENYIAAIEAKGKLTDGDATAARKLAKQSLGGPTRAHAYPNFVEAAVELSTGATDPALKAYETAIAGPEPAGALYSEAAAVYLQSGKPDKAVQTLEGGWARFQQPPSLAVPLIRTYRLAGRRADAHRIAAECAARWPGMQEVCVAETK